MTRTTKKVLLRSYYLFFAAGISGLIYCAIVTIEARHYQSWAGARLEHSRYDAEVLLSSSVPVRSSPRALLPRISQVALVGRVQVPRLQLSAMIAEGATAHVLGLAVGHVPGTALPGQPGNMVLAAHRDTFFRRLDHLEPGDVIRITGPQVGYNYRVTFTDIVNPDETWVLQPTSGETLTLITCYPFHFVGPAPKRFVVRARRLDCN